MLLFVLRFIAACKRRSRNRPCPIGLCSKWCSKELGESLFYCWASCVRLSVGWIWWKSIKLLSKEKRWWATSEERANPFALI